MRLNCQVFQFSPNYFYLLTICSKDKEAFLFLSDSFCLYRNVTADHMSIESVLLMHFQTAKTPLADFSVYDLAHGWVFDLHLGCATCCSWLDDAVFHQRKIRSALSVAVRALFFAAAAKAGQRDDWALTTVSWGERDRWQERVVAIGIGASLTSTNKQREHRL